MTFVIVAGLAIVLYFLPALIAYRRIHPQRMAIGVLNFLGGWTVAGWLIALVWSCTTPAQLVKGAAAALDAKTFCSNCGLGLATDTQFCPRCGTQRPS